MNKKVTYLIFCFVVIQTLSLFSQANDVGQREVYSFYLPFQKSIINRQYDFYDNKIPVDYDFNSVFGGEFIKYYPNKNNFNVYNFGFNNRNVLLNSTPPIFFNEQQINIIGVFNTCFSKKKPPFEDITKPYIGAGLSYSFTFNSDLFYGDNNDKFSKLLNKHKFEGVINFGILEDVFNITNRTSVSKLNLLLRFPIFQLGNNFTSKYLNLPQEIIDFEKSKTSKISFEITYNHSIDSRKNRRSDYRISFDSLNWNEINDNFKSFFPPLINNKKPDRNFFGNFYYEVSLYDFLDSLLINSENEKFGIKNKFGNYYTFGYTLNFLGNYSKDYSQEQTGIGVYHSKSKWRRNLFLSCGFSNYLIKAENKFDNVLFFKNTLDFNSGLRIVRIRDSIDKPYLHFILGVGYKYTQKYESYHNMSKIENITLSNTRYFVGFGINNYILKIILNSTDFNKINFRKGFGFSMNVGI
ncbi:MAG: hypothetical protein R2771_06575 [Saprospiraceae bacterium]